MTFEEALELLKTRQAGSPAAGLLSNPQSHEPQQSITATQRPDQPRDATALLFEEARREASAPNGLI